jgi:hypothetical protein
MDLESFLTYINMTTIKTWLLLAVEGERSYGGNDGYDDIVESTYRWDSSVPNFRSISEGDALLVWNKKELLGLAIVRDLFRKEARKARHRCPKCNSSKIKPRTTKRPTYRCGNQECAEVFDIPITEWIEVDEYVANYAGTWIPMKNSLDATGCRKLSTTPKSQLSIRPGDIDLISHFLQLQINLQSQS